MFLWSRPAGVDVSMPWSITITRTPASVGFVPEAEDHPKRPPKSVHLRNDDRVELACRHPLAKSVELGAVVPDAGYAVSRERSRRRPILGLGSKPRARVT